MTRAALALLAVLVAAGCTAPPSPQTPPATPEAMPAAPATPQAAAPKLPPPKTPLDAYKREVAQRILDRSADRVFQGRPPHMLKAVVVLQVTVDARGKVTQVKTLRTRDQALARVASDSVRAAAPLPPPPERLLRRGSLELAETWLFRDDDRFQVRSLAEDQPPGD